MKPALVENAGCGVSISVLYGLFGGVFIDRAVRLWLLAKDSIRVNAKSSMTNGL